MGLGVNVFQPNEEKKCGITEIEEILKGEKTWRRKR
jgi:hypothetical protein